MLLQIVTFTRDVTNDGLSSGQLDSRDPPISRVGLLGRHGEDLAADAFTLRIAQERWGARTGRRPARGS